MDVMFGEKSAFEDFGLRLSTFTIDPPEPKRTTVSVTGRNGDLDLTYALSDEIYYNNRNINFVFYIVDLNKDWDANYEAIMNYLHGQKRNVVFEDDNAWYWDCFCQVASINTKHQVGIVEITCIAYPYKKKQTQVTRSITNQGTVTLNNNRMRTIPQITSTKACRIEFENKSIAIPAGESVSSDIVLKEGNNALTVVGTTNITFSYTEGSL